MIANRVISKTMKTSLPNRCLTLLIALWTVSACSSVKVVEKKSADDFNLTNYKTFDFYKLSGNRDTVIMQYKKNLDLIEQQITSELQSLGLKQSSTDPELLINLGIVVEEKNQTRETNLITDPPMYIGQRNYTWQSQEVVVGTYKEGTLSVHLVDRSNKKLMWEGEAQGVLPKKEENLQSDIKTAVQKLFADFH